MSKILQFNIDHGLLKIDRRAEHVVRLQDDQISISIDGGDFDVTWRLTKKQAKQLIVALRRAMLNGEQSKVEQTFTRVAGRRR